MLLRAAWLVSLLTVACAKCAVAALPYNGPNLSFMPIGGIVASGSNITITPVGGQAGSSTAYTCSPPPGVTVTQASGSLTAGETARSLNISCPAGTPDGPMMCVAAGLPPVVYQYVIDCPGGGLLMTANPATQTRLSCDGVPGTLARAEVTFTAWQPVSGLQCSLGGTGFSLAVAPSTVLAPGESTRVEVACDPPPFGQPARTGSLLCSAPAAGQFAYSLSSLGRATGAPTHAVVVPATARAVLATLVALLALAAAAALRRRV
jgi:hypothetical protein